MSVILLIALTVAAEPEAKPAKNIKTFDHLGRQWAVSNVGTYIKMKDGTFHEVKFSKKPIKDVIKKKDDSIIIVYDPKKIPSRGVSASTWEILYSDIENGVVANPNLPEVEKEDIPASVLKALK